jgi:hypothetical protein
VGITSSGPATAPVNGGGGVGGGGGSVQQQQQQPAKQTAVMSGGPVASENHQNHQQQHQQPRLSRTNLYIRGLGPDTTDKDLVSLCQQSVNPFTDFSAYSSFSFSLFPSRLPQKSCRSIRL